MSNIPMKEAAEQIVQELKSEEAKQTLTVVKEGKLLKDNIHTIAAIHSWPTGFQELLFRDRKHLENFAKANNCRIME